MKCRIKKIGLALTVLLLASFISANYAFSEGPLEGQAKEYFQQAVQAQKSGELDYAISLYTKAIYAKPDFAAAHNNIGTAYTQKHDYAKAEEEYNKAIMIDSNYSIALKNMAIMYAERKDYDKFYEYWKRATGLGIYSPFLIDDEEEKKKD